MDTLAIPATCSLCWAGERTRAGLWGETLGQALCKALPTDRWASGLVATRGQEEGPGNQARGPHHPRGQAQIRTGIKEAPFN